MLVTYLVEEAYSVRQVEHGVADKVHKRQLAHLVQEGILVAVEENLRNLVQLW